MHIALIDIATGSEIHFHNVAQVQYGFAVFGDVTTHCFQLIYESKRKSDLYSSDLYRIALITTPDKLDD